MVKGIYDISANDDEEKRTTLSLSLTVGDKKALKLIAMEHNTTIAAIIHEWITKHMDDTAGGM